MTKITIEQCRCRNQACRDYWLVGVGKFVQGSGFTQDTAQRIADLMNVEEKPETTVIECTSLWQMVWFLVRARLRGYRIGKLSWRRGRG